MVGDVNFSLSSPLLSPALWHGLNKRCGGAQRTMPIPNNWSWKRWDVICLGVLWRLMNKDMQDNVHFVE